MSGLDSILDVVSQLSSDELAELQSVLDSIREQRKNRDTLRNWASKGTKDSPRAVKHMSFRSKQGWIVVVALFSEGQQEMFREIHQNKDQAHELAARVAVENSNLLNPSEPMVIW